jgi:hypothetical protein
MTEIQWRDRLQPAMEEARDARKPLLLYFSESTWARRADVVPDEVRAKVAAEQTA